VADNDRIVIDVDDPRIRRGPLRDLVRVVRGRQAASDVEELPDAVHPDKLLDRVGEE
jgi:hypothetical protein